MAGTMLPASSYCADEITVSEKVFVVSNAITVQPRINLESISKSTDYFKNVYDEPWIAARVNRCIEDNTLQTEITEPQFCVFINDYRRFVNRHVFCISDGRTKIPFITSSNISENLDLYYNQQMNWTGYIILINTYRLNLLDANFVIESDNYVLLEFDEDACNVINKRMKWLKWSECIPCIADLMKDKLGVEAYIPDDQKQDWRDILISNKKAVNEIESDSSNISDEDTEGRSIPPPSQNISHDKDTSPLPVAVQKGTTTTTTTTENQFNGDSLISFNDSEMSKQNSRIDLPMTSTPQSNATPLRPSLTISKLQSLVKENFRCILKTNCKEVNSSPDVVKQRPATSIPQNKPTEDVTPLRLNGTSINGSKLKEADFTCKLVVSEAKTCDFSPDEHVLSNLSADVVLEPSKIDELRELKYIRDKRGKLYKLVIESQSEVESSCEEEEPMDIEVTNYSENIEVKTPTEMCEELMQIDDGEDEEIVNSQEEIVPKIQSSIRRLSAQIDVNQDISLQPQNLFPTVIHVDHGKQVCKKIQIGSAESFNKLSYQVLSKPWQHVSKMTLNSGHDTEELIKIIQKQRTNPNEFKPAFLKHLNSVVNRDKS